MAHRYSSLDLKVVVLGVASVGKTSIINRYCNGSFNEDTLSTIGAGFFTHSIKLNDTEVTLMLWDTAGEERFRSVAPSLLRGANGLVLVYDVTNVQSFNELEIYLEMFLDAVNVNAMSTMPVLLLGNKCDLGESAISEQNVTEWKKKHRITFSSVVSAKTGENINAAFTDLVTVLAAPENFIDKPPMQFVVPKEEKENGLCNC
ncbi:small GTP-binding protein [Tritrichomonas foetus]|uniref:Small GTP-binding protein n=1 Tax=Tritrichomonas foetus TaxID=1144522 RepID=A0A1J4J878_9EUKA|nr:small GTP-binding protein [Tritrichomonas foetus]|eukprot:OHS94447.1 small GTP-binding protein [Tritrichomonas foetus]